MPMSNSFVQVGSFDSVCAFEVGGGGGGEGGEERGGGGGGGGAMGSICLSQISRS